MDKLALYREKITEIDALMAKVPQESLKATLLTARRAWVMLYELEKQDLERARSLEPVEEELEPVGPADTGPTISGPSSGPQ